ncbi:hypothetical protein D9M71_159250 [compost metagenome]
MQDVHQQQFLMLLLMRKPQLDQFGGGGGQRRSQQGAHVYIHMLAVVQHLAHARTGHQPALRPGMARADGFVIGVEQVSKGRIERAVANDIFSQHKRLEEPGDMRHVPLGGAGIGHGLHDHVLRAERCRQALGAAANSLVAFEQRATFGNVASLA